MDIEKVKSAQSQEEARNYAIEWQNWVSSWGLSWNEVLRWQHVFEDLAEKYDLWEEFRENGII